ncbi:MAG: hydroxymethylbilane synthase, partial [Pseudomonadota bacterium]
LSHKRPDLTVVEFRGNVQTRMQKLGDGVAEATFLAMAGLNRLALSDVPRTAIETEEMLPAVAQGAIGIERRSGDSNTAALLAAIHHGPTGQRLAAERKFLLTLDGSCETPIAGLAELEGGTLHLRGEILRADGSDVLREVGRAPIEDGAALGAALGQKLLDRAPKGFFDWRS